MLLILGCGWTGDFLVELLGDTVPFACTTRDGRPVGNKATIAWTLSHPVDVSSLPLATTVVITFPVKEPALLTELVRSYEAHHGTTSTHWVQLSSTRPFAGPGPHRRNAALDTSKDTGRMPAEQVLLDQHNGSVLHLAGLWGGQRQPRNWVNRFKSTDALLGKVQVRQLHLIHGKDVARAILAVHQQQPFQPGQRWIVSDGGCYDWLRIFQAWGTDEQKKEIQDLLDKEQPGASIDALVAAGGVIPRLDASEFWQAHHLEPTEFLSIE
ncbi:hypothetical protein BC940DRAFT_46556 [Gongronella butleri]|nr:hypothetical protein BC940DRAFT_46556 [Gongronella butleri]